jgi:hypothetical protein
MIPVCDRTDNLNIIITYKFLLSTIVENHGIRTIRTDTARNRRPVRTDVLSEPTSCQNRRPVRTDRKKVPSLTEVPLYIGTIIYKGAYE